MNTVIVNVLQRLVNMSRKGVSYVVVPYSKSLEVLLQVLMDAGYLTSMKMRHEAGRTYLHVYLRYREVVEYETVQVPAVPLLDSPQTSVQTAALDSKTNTKGKKSNKTKVKSTSISSGPQTTSSPKKMDDTVLPVFKFERYEKKVLTPSIRGVQIFQSPGKPNLTVRVPTLLILSNRLHTTYIVQRSNGMVTTAQNAAKLRRGGTLLMSIW